MNADFGLKRWQYFLMLTSVTLLGTPVMATAQPANLHVVVTSNQDTLQADDGLTLREAIELVNGTLSVDQLSPTEQELVSPNLDRSPLTEPIPINEQAAQITFNLPPEQTTIELVNPLPAITTPGVIVDGTTQPGYEPSRVIPGAIPIVTPMVSITPAPGHEIARGFTLVADRITIRGLRLYGFNASPTTTLQTPPADIFIAHPFPPPDTSQQEIPNAEAPFYESNIPPKDIVIEDNWLGISPDDQVNESSASIRQSTQPSAFGVYVFNSNGVTIVRNAIAFHQGSGIITSVRGNNLLIQDNLITDNGFQGMPDAIRLEGEIENSRVLNNLIRGNAGSAIFVFKPTGSVTIQGNVMTDNGRRFQRAAVYLTGSDHRVMNNQIGNQPGPGVVVAAFPKSDRNIIQDNQFSNLQGLSIDLVSQFGTNVRDYQQGDGANPPINHYQQQRQAANWGINAPHFISQEFFSNPQTQTVTLFGEAPNGSMVEVYRVTESTGIQGPLNQAIATVEVDENGTFSITLDDVKPGDQISAIATHPDYGTSEPAVNTVIRSLVSTSSTP